MSTPCIVVLDDHPAVLNGLAAYLGVHGYEVLVHPRADDAVAVIGRLQPRVVLIDLHFGFSGAGLQIVRALRATPATAQLPVVVWSTDPTVAYHVAALALPGVAAVSKYADPATLRSALARAAGTGLREQATLGDQPT